MVLVVAAVRKVPGRRLGLAVPAVAVPAGSVLTVLTLRALGAAAVVVVAWQRVVMVGRGLAAL